MRKYIWTYGLVSFLAFAVLMTVLARSIDFENRYAHVLYAQDEIISAQVSEDEQWRIRCDGKLPDKLATSLILFEDQYFKYHFGINPISIIKAMRDNCSAGKIVRGGSTITMQLARIHEGNRPRTYKQKCKEILLAIAIECRYSKKEILKLYAQHAPFGGNTVGYCAAAYRYYGKSAEDLSWMEAASLSVLPNSPSKIYPGKQQQALLRKRNFLLQKLLNNNYIDSISYRLSILESLPTRSHNFNAIAPHLLQRLKKSKPNNYNYASTIDPSLQFFTNETLNEYSDNYALTSGVNNACAIILRKDGSVAAYTSNVNCNNDCASDVDILMSPRSPGSTLKPFLYGLAIDQGMITPRSLLEDIPTFYNGYTPRNYDKKFRGIIPADKALTTSLNIPAVNLLQSYGTHPFLADLQKMELSSIDKNADHYGLSIILGGCEVTPVELARAYMNMSRVSRGEDAIDLSYLLDDATKSLDDYPMSQGGAYLTLDILKGVSRPENENGWQFLVNQIEISWKTGTSFGFRDAWSVGCSGDYTVLVWVGNADGEGRQGLTGMRKAAPILFDIFRLLPNSKPISIPSQELKVKYLCKQSGYIPTASCTQVEGQLLPSTVHQIPVCQYHKMVTLDTSENYQIYQHCEDQVITKSLFVLDPIINNYYKKNTGLSHEMPKYKDGCGGQDELLRIVYPTQSAEILLPIDVDNRKQALIGKALSSPGIDSIYWFVDHELKSITHTNHEVKLDLDSGNHTLTLVGSNGSEITHNFDIIN